MIICFMEDVYREELLEKARETHPHRLLVCVICGWSWLTTETARVDSCAPDLGVACMDKNDCFRRENMKMKGKR